MPKKKAKSEVEGNRTPTAVSVTNRVTDREAKKLFIESAPKRKDNGSNSILEAFLVVMQRVSESMTSYSLPDVLVFAKALDLPTDEVVSLFDKYTYHMCNLGK